MVLAYHQGAKHVESIICMYIAEKRIPSCEILPHRHGGCLARTQQKGALQLKRPNAVSGVRSVASCWRLGRTCCSILELAESSGVRIGKGMCPFRRNAIIALNNASTFLYSVLDLLYIYRKESIGTGAYDQITV